MTAFGRAAVSSPLGQWVVEIHSINRKFFDLSIYLPKELVRFDPEIRKWVSEAISRGQIALRIFSPLEGSLSTTVHNLKELKSFWDKTTKELGYSGVVSIEFLMEQMRFLPQTIQGADEDTIKNSLKQAVEEALKDLIKMKEREGSALQKDIQARFKTIEQALAQIESKAGSSVSKYKEKMEQTLKEISYPKAELETRLLQEVALMAEKLDITEEITRLRSHLNQASSTESGKTLEFLIQEMNREINTIAAKSSDLEITQQTIMMKAEVEKIREQLQNIE